MHKFLKPLTVVAIMLSLSACSVYKAASNEGISASDIKKCTTRACFLGHGMEIIDKQTDEEGRVTEIYRAVARKSGGNYVRAAGHGLLDVATLGLWEVAGTPIEGAMSNNRGYITAKVTYAEPDIIESFVIYDAHGKEAARASIAEQPRLRLEK